MKMDRNSADHSPTLSDNVGGPWMHYWENELGSVSGLNLDNSRELNKLVEDKEVAARAVAFVVNSSRKGIVPLCADVAHLLRAKKSLENKLIRTRSENEILRRASASGSAQTSHSASPTPPSIHSLGDRRSLLQDQSSQTQESPRPISSCSHCSSSLSNSPKVSKFHEPNLPQSRQRAPQHHMTNNHCSQNLNNHTLVTKAEVHNISKNGMWPDSTVVDIEQELCNEIEGNHPLTRKNSLPEMVSQPCGNVPKVSPRAIKCKGTQCLLLCSRPCEVNEDIYKETVKMNSRLTEELGAAKKEIEFLKERLRELEMNNLAGQLTEKFYMDEETDVNGEVSHSDDEHYFLPVIHKPQNSRSSPHLRTAKRSSSCPFTLPGPLSHCRCDMCETLVQTGNAEVKLKTATERKSLTSSLQIKVNDYVVVKGKRTGHVRYLGHLDNIGQPNAIFVGLDLDAPVGKHDGSHDGKRYFECKKQHGIFLPLQEVICIVRPQKTSVSLKSEVCKKRSFKEGKRPSRQDSEKCVKSGSEVTKPTRHDLDRYNKSGSEVVKLARHDSEKCVKSRSEVKCTKPEEEKQSKLSRTDGEKCSKHESDKSVRHSKSDVDRYTKFDSEKVATNRPSRSDSDRCTSTEAEKIPLRQLRTDTDRSSKLIGRQHTLDASDVVNEKLHRKESGKQSRRDVYRVDSDRNSKEYNARTENSRNDIEKHSKEVLECDKHKSYDETEMISGTKKSSQGHREKRERSRISEKRRAHETSAIKREISPTNTQTV